MVDASTIVVPSFFMVMNTDGTLWRTRYMKYRSESWTKEREKAGVFMTIGQARCRATRAVLREERANRSKKNYVLSIPVVVEFKGGEVILHPHDEQMNKYRVEKAKKETKRAEQMKKFRGGFGF